MRWAWLVVVGLLAAVSLALPPPTVPTPAVPDVATGPAFTVCPLGEGTGGTALALASTASGTADLSVFLGGEEQAAAPAAMGATGGTVVPLSDLTGLAVAPVLVELPVPTAGVTTLLSGDGLASASCRAGSAEPVVVVGGSTTEGESFSLVVANPFVGEATVDITATSEVGVEAEPSLSGIVVPPRSAVTVDLDAVLPGRIAMSAAVDATTGRVVVGGLQGGGGDVAATSGEPPSLDWFVPLPGRAGSLVIATPTAAEVAYQIDVYGPEGIVQAAVEGTVPARGQVTLRAADLLEGPGAFRVVAAAPVVAGLKVAGEGVRMIVPGVADPAPRWLLPGAGVMGPTQAWILNTGEVDANVEITSLSEDIPSSTAVVLPGLLTPVELPVSPAGAALSSDVDLAVIWVSSSEQGRAGDVGIPIE